MRFNKDPLELVDQEKVSQFSEKMVYGGCGSINITGSWGKYVDILWEFPEDIDSDTYHIKTEIVMQLREYLLSLGCEVSYRTKAVPRPD